MTTHTERCALVVGGGRGLGAEIVRALAHRGHKVALTYRDRREEAEALQRELAAHGADVHPMQGDARDFRRAHELVDEVVSRWGRLDVLVHNAGFARSGPLWKLSEDDWDAVVDTSLKGAFNYVHAAAPVMIKQAGGRVVCIGSINGLRGRLGSLSYNVAKAGLTGLIKTVAAELGRYQVTANVVAPGYVETPSQAQTPELVRDLVLKECAIKRLGQPEDIVPMVAFLCSEEARHVTGQTIKVDAGQYL